MNSMRMAVRSCCLLLSAAASPLQAQDSGWFFTMNVGKADQDERGLDDSDMQSYYLGKRIDETFAFDFGLVYMKGFDVSGRDDTEIEIEGVEAALRAAADIGDHLSVLARLGGMVWSQDTEVMGTEVADDSDVSLVYGFGVEIPFQPKAGGRIVMLEYEDISGADITTLTFGIYAIF